MIRTSTAFFSTFALALYLTGSPASASHLDAQIASIKKDLKAIHDWCDENETDQAKFKKCLEDEGYDDLLKELEELEKFGAASSAKHDDPDTEKRLKKLADQAKKKAKGK